MQAAFLPDLLTANRSKYLNNQFKRLLCTPRSEWPAGWSSVETPFLHYLGAIDTEFNAFSGILSEPELMPGDRIVPFTVAIKRQGTLKISANVQRSFSNQQVNFQPPRLKIHLFKLGFAIIVLNIPFECGDGLDPDNFVRAINRFNWEPQNLRLTFRDHHKVGFGFVSKSSGEDTQALTTRELFKLITGLVKTSMITEEHRKGVELDTSRIYPVILLRDTLLDQWSDDRGARRECLQAIATIHELAPISTSVRDGALEEFRSRYGALYTDFALPTDRMFICGQYWASPREKDYHWHLIYSLEVAFALKTVLSFFCDRMNEVVRNAGKRSFDFKSKMKSLSQLSGADSTLVDSISEILSYEELIKHRYRPWFKICCDSLEVRETAIKLDGYRQAYVDLGIAWKSPLVTAACKVADLSTRLLP